MVTCLDCGWFGDPSELEAKTESLEDNDYCHCPQCGGKDIEDMEEAESGE